MEKILWTKESWEVRALQWERRKLEMTQMLEVWELQESLQEKLQALKDPLDQQKLLWTLWEPREAIWNVWDVREAMWEHKTSLRALWSLEGCEVLGRLHPDEQPLLLVLRKQEALKSLENSPDVAGTHRLLTREIREIELQLDSLTIIGAVPAENPTGEQDEENFQLQPVEPAPTEDEQLNDRSQEQTPLELMGSHSADLE